MKAIETQPEEKSPKKGKIKGKAKKKRTNYDDLKALMNAFGTTVEYHIKKLYQYFLNNK